MRENKLGVLVLFPEFGKRPDWWGPLRGMDRILLLMSDGIIMESRLFSSAEERRLKSLSKFRHVLPSLPSKETSEPRLLMLFPASRMAQTSPASVALHLVCRKMSHCDTDSSPDLSLLILTMVSYRHKSLLHGTTVHFSSSRCYIFQTILFYWWGVE